LKGCTPSFWHSLQHCSMVTIVPDFETWSMGFSDLQLKQNIEKMETKQERKTRNFGSSWGEAVESIL
jgi:hypothetical protein